jgi:ankyrin repeat protein
LRRIYDTLKKRGVDCLAADGFGRTALHYAVASRSRELVDLLIREGASASSIDMHGYSPLTLYLRGKSAASTQLHYPGTGAFDPIFEALANNGADLNLLYPETDFEPAYKEDTQSLQKGTIADQYDKSVYKTTILINLVRQLAGSGDKQDEERLTASLIGLLQRGARFNISDSDGRDAMAHAILNNNLGLVKFLIANRQLGLLVSNVQDHAGKSSAHFVVNPCKFGSYENVQILEELGAAGHELGCHDSAGKQPI